MHLSGCPYGDNRAMQNGQRRWLKVKPEPTPPKKILTSTGNPWVSPKRPNPRYRSRHNQQAKTNYKLVLQFWFQRPIDLGMWKAIKAPSGWRKSPVNKSKMNEYMGVRFLCRDLKYSLTPEQVETLRATLYMSLATEW